MAVKLWPMARGTFWLSSGFGPRWGVTHRGLDLATNGGVFGTPIYAAADGLVVRSGPASGFGHWIVVDHQTTLGVDTVYGHMYAKDLLVREGAWVRAGQHIANVGSDGESSGPHLHFEVWGPPGRFGGSFIDPEVWLEDAAYPGEQEEVSGMGPAVLSAAMGGSLSTSRYAELLPGFVAAMRAAEINTVDRAAMWCAQIGHESAGLRYMEEIASGAAYEYRTDLGNTFAGDGVRFKGSGPIQLTGRHNFTLFSRWCAARGYTSDPGVVVNNPDMVRDDPRFGFLAASWYWTVARPQINAMADRRDLEGVTRAINGGLNGLADRRARYQRCLVMGESLLPQDEEEISMSAKDDIIGFIKGYVGPVISDVKDVREQLTGGRDWGEFPGWPQLGQNDDGANMTVVDSLADTRRRVIALEEKFAAAAEAAGSLPGVPDEDAPA
ncbi:peptidoglycan DD-metalloendopeptidase family protein [Tomitella gaofuii]|uniref:peptidoglycan DD-metalloendopeptidase family protein n=1 Tax=Tomitella gaofuii TaxID=2760083 RepID=UPI001F322F3E|nr:peptidoglycan DD-metalloendopeptidase family protein [Tomitella gaofuii]